MYEIIEIIYPKNPLRKLQTIITNGGNKVEVEICITPQDYGSNYYVMVICDSCRKILAKVGSYRDKKKYKCKDKAVKAAIALATIKLNDTEATDPHQRELF